MQLADQQVGGCWGGHAELALQSLLIFKYGIIGSQNELETADGAERETNMQASEWVITKQGLTSP